MHVSCYYTTNVRCLSLIIIKPGSAANIFYAVRIRLIQRNHRKYDAHERAVDGPIIPIEKEQDTDTDVKASFYAEIAHAFGNDSGFRGIHKDAH